MDLNLLSTFVMVAEQASFSLAAQTLGVPTSTASRAVVRLETELATRLFHRTTRHVSLTPDGAALLERVGPMLVALEGALDTAVRTDEPRGLLRITAAPDIGSSLLASVVAKFTQRYPLVTVDVALTSRKVNLVAEGFDCAVRGIMGKLADSSLVAKKLVPIEAHVYASPAYLRLHPAPKQPRDIAEHTWIGFRDWKPPKEITLPAAGARITCDDFDFLRETLRAGAGLGLLPRMRAEADVAEGRLVQVLPQVCQREGHLVFMYAKTAQLAPTIAAFRDFLIEQLPRAV